MSFALRYVQNLNRVMAFSVSLIVLRIKLLGLAARAQIDDGLRWGRCVREDSVEAVPAQQIVECL